MDAVTVDRRGVEPSLASDGREMFLPLKPDQIQYLDLVMCRLCGAVVVDLTGASAAHASLHHMHGSSPIKVNGRQL